MFLLTAWAERKVLISLWACIGKLVNLTHTCYMSVCVLVGSSVFLWAGSLWDVWQRHLRGPRDTRHNSFSSLHLSFLGGVGAWRWLRGQVAALQKSRWWPAPPILLNQNARTAILGEKKRFSSSSPIIKIFTHKHRRTCTHLDPLAC